MMRCAVMLVMDGIKEFEFNEHGLQKLKELQKGTKNPENKNKDKLAGGLSYSR